ncbi:hypothetical protein EHS25_003349 [Saitozyma podzolica]|uniref:Uncharacterized protein n=1 Tax=Saitozyma podzolica TaxID=1890683 RepID=A0A427Y8L3_9TREE|nr:hypothetical protein EHS25_003349 [Saitozyma podzolica]
MSSSAQTPATVCSCSTTKAGETCNCKPECKCAPGTCECGTCPNSSKNKAATCNCKPDCKCAPGACTCPGCPKSQKA